MTNVQLANVDGLDARNVHPKKVGDNKYIL